MFERIFIERDLLKDPATDRILSRYPDSQILEIDRYDQIWGRVRKPYLEKRHRLDLFLARKRGALVKSAPPAYGLGDNPHFYFVHAYNCIYECQYCYLQGYFDSPDIVLFLNHQEIFQAIRDTALAHRSCTPWFHAGEFSDSLALSHLSGELEGLFSTFREIPWAKLELRTKSVNIKPLLSQTPLANVTVSFSLSPESQAKTTELKTPGTRARLEAVRQLAAAGFNIGIHFDPIIPTPKVESEYQELFAHLASILPIDQMSYASLGVVRFTPEVYAQMQKNYPDANLHYSELTKSFDNKIRLPRALRLPILQGLQQQLGRHYPAERIYLCMED